MPQPRNKPAEPAPRPTSEEIRALQVSAALEDAATISDEWETLVARRKANREELRTLVALGVVSDEDKKLISELYPPRPPKSNGDTADTPAAA